MDERKIESNTEYYYISKTEEENYLAKLLFSKIDVKIGRDNNIIETVRIWNKYPQAKRFVELTEEEFKKFQDQLMNGNIVEFKPLKTVIVNLFAGPGAGKTTCAWEIAAELKKQNINVEYVSEYAKELVWDDNYMLLQNQEHVTDTQYHRLNRLKGKVDVIVTDSPVLLGLVYGKNLSEEYKAKALTYHKSFETFNLIIKRGEYYQQAGRIQNKEQAIEIDNKIHELLKSQNIYFGEYTHSKIDTVVNNIITTLKRLNPESLLNSPVNKDNTEKASAKTKEESQDIKDNQNEMMTIEKLRIYKETGDAVMVKIKDKSSEKNSIWLPKSAIKYDSEFVIGAKKDIAIKNNLKTIPPLKMTAKR